MAAKWVKLPHPIRFARATEKAQLWCRNVRYAGYRQSNTAPSRGAAMCLLIVVTTDRHLPLRCAPPEIEPEIEA